MSIENAMCEKCAIKKAFIYPFIVSDENENHYLCEECFSIFKANDNAFWEFKSKILNVLDDYHREMGNNFISKV